MNTSITTSTTTSTTSTTTEILKDIADTWGVDLSQYALTLQNNLLQTAGDLRGLQPEYWIRLALPVKLEQELKTRLNIGPTPTSQVDLSSVYLLDETRRTAWGYTVLVNIDGADQCTGILIYSGTNPNNRHLLLNLHTFQQHNKDCEHLAVPGFPAGYESQFYHLAGKEIPKKKKKKLNNTSDNLKINVSKVKFEEVEGVVSEKLNRIFSETLTNRDIIYCSGDRDVIVLFDCPFPGTSVAPVTQEVRRCEKVHLYGFAIENTAVGPESFIVPGEIIKLSGGKISVSCITAPGLSGGAVITDQYGGVVAYNCGGQRIGNDDSFFGSFAFTIGPVYETVREIDKKKEEAEGEEEEEEEEEEKKEKPV